MRSQKNVAGHEQTIRALCTGQALGSLPRSRNVVRQEEEPKRQVRGKAARWSLAALLLIVLRATALQAERPGDADCNNILGPDDLTVAATWIFRSPPWPCLSVDGNGDGRLSAADFSALAAAIAAPVPVGPVMTFLGLASADGTPFSVVETVQGVPVYARPAGQGFKVVIEARPGRNGVSVGQVVFQRDPLRPEVRPDLWVLVSEPLGDGSRTVCEGGVPAVHPPDFRPLRSVTDAINDLGCNVTVATSPAFACTQDRFGRGAFVGDGTQVQFCFQVSRALVFRDGETLLSAVVRDVAGNLGPLGQIRVRVGPGPFPPSPTPTSTATVTPPVRPPTFTPRPSATPTNPPSTTPTRSASPTRPKTATPTPTQPPSATATPTGIAPSATRTPTRSATSTARDATSTPSTQVPTASFSPTITASNTRIQETPTTTATPPRTASATRTATSSLSPSSTATRSATRSPTPTRSPSSTATRSLTPTRTQAAASGPVVTYFGLTRADDTLLDPAAISPEGIPIFVRPQGFGFNVVVEAGRGVSGLEVGQQTYVPSLTSLPDLQIVASRPLGDGSEVVCDSSGPNAGGVPAVHPPQFTPTEDVIRAVNDLACRFVDGTGRPQGRGSGDACTRVPPEQDFGFVAGSATAVQFCAPVTRAMEFPPGDTLLTVRVLDRASPDAPPGSGTPGPVARIIVRVGSAQPVSATPTSTPTPTLTRTPTRTATPTFRDLSPTATRTPSRTASPSTSPDLPLPTPSPTRTATRTATGTATRTRTRTATATRTASPTATVSLGPVVTFFGLARADGLLVPAEGNAEDGTPIFRRPLGAGFTLVLEAKPGASGRPVGLFTFRSDLSDLPDLQIVASRPLGDGSEEVCDARPPAAGGVPATDPPRFDQIGVVNDLACRFRDGVDQPQGRTAVDACVQFENGSFGFVAADSTVQFCALVDRAWAFPDGDTLLTARVRDASGNVGATARILVRVGGSP